MWIISFCVKFSSFFFNLKSSLLMKKKKYNVILLYKETDNFLTNDEKNDLSTELCSKQNKKKTTLVYEIKCKTVGF